jgi:hypothetical protein
MKQTAVEWLVEQMTQGDFIALPKPQWIKQAKEMEKEQIMEAYGNVCFDEDGNYLTAEQYYNETFKSQEDDKV